MTHICDYDDRRFTLYLAFVHLVQNVGIFQFQRSISYFTGIVRANLPHNLRHRRRHPGLSINEPLVRELIIGDFQFWRSI